MQTQTEPVFFTDTLKRIPEVNSVSYEYPGFWVIKTTKGEFHLGNANGNYGWNSPEGEQAVETDTDFDLMKVASQFAEFITKKEN